MTTSLKTSPRIVEWLANSLLTLVFILFSHSVHAAESIKGGFGLVLGQAFEPPADSRINLDRKMLGFSYPAPLQTPELTEFLVMATPVTFRVWAIAATGKSEGLKPCLDKAASLFSMISEKYGGDEYGASLHEYTDGRGWFLTQARNSRTVRVICNEKGELTQTYLDDALRQTADVEQRELNQITSDYDAAQYEKILPRVRDLADQGNLWAETLLGLMYRKGAGVVHDDETAEDYYQRAARRGWINAQYNLGIVYLSQFRYKPAELWLLKAADREHAEAQEALAELYMAKSPLRSEEKAFSWSLRAAEHGRPNAQYYACFYYANGVGVARDMVEGYKWCYIAARHHQARADRDKDQLGEQMAPQEVARARELAERWLAEHGGT